MLPELAPKQTRIKLFGDRFGERGVQADGTLVQGQQIGERQAAEQAAADGRVTQKHGKSLSLVKRFL